MPTKRVGKRKLVHKSEDKSVQFGHVYVCVKAWLTAG
jgi:hypothetical protein